MILMDNWKNMWSVIGKIHNEQNQRNAGALVGVILMYKLRYIHERQYNIRRNAGLLSLYRVRMQGRAKARAIATAHLSMHSTQAVYHPIHTNP